MLALAFSLAALGFLPGGAIPRAPTLSRHASSVAPVALLDLFRGKKKFQKEESALTTGVSQVWGAYCLETVVHGV